MREVAVVDLLVAVERLVARHRDELDALNVFPVPDADTGRNVLATVRSARVGAEQAAPGQQRRAAVQGALLGARGNAGSLVSQLLRGLLEDTDAAAEDDAVDDADVDPDTWPARLHRADRLARAAVARPVEGTLLTAVREAAAAAAGHDAAADQLAAAVAAAHRAVEASPTRLEVLARAGVVDAGARAAALVLEAVASVVCGRPPSPPPVHVPPGGPSTAGCEPSATRFEVMYLLDPATPDAAARLREALERTGESVVVVAADRLVSVHVHTDEIGAALDAGLAHGRPHHVRVEDLFAATHEGAVRSAHPAGGAALTSAVGLVVGADGVGIARLAASSGAITVPVDDPDRLAAAIGRTRRSRVVFLPGDPALVAAAAALAIDGVAVEVVTAADDAARVLAALAVLDPALPDAALLGEVAAAVTTAVVRVAPMGWHVEVEGEVVGGGATALAALDAAAAALDGDGRPELASLLLGDEVGIALREAAASALRRRWPDAELDVVDAELRGATFVVGVE